MLEDWKIMALNLTQTISSLAVQVLTFVDEAVDAAKEAGADAPSSALYSAAAAGCLIAPVACVFLYRKCTQEQYVPNDEEYVLGNIHYLAGSIDVEHTKRCIELLKKHPTFVNKALSDQQQISHGYTPFLRACWNNNYELIHFMLQIGADIRLTNSDGESALYLVAYRVSKSSKWDPRALNLLWNSGCSVDEVNVHNNSMLHLAAKAGNSTLTRWLLLHGADPEIVNTARYTPRRLALKKGSPAHMAVAELLQTCKDNERRTIVLRSDGILLTRHHRAVTDL